MLIVRVTTAIMNHAVNQDEKATSVSCQMAAWFPDIFGDFNLQKNHYIDNNSETTDTKEKYNHRLGITRILRKF